MKNYDDFRMDLLKDDRMRMELRKMLGQDTIEFDAGHFDKIHEFAILLGYEFTLEDMLLAAAERRDLSQEELQLVTGGGYADLINHSGETGCKQNNYCYNDYSCDLTQHIHRSGYWSPGVCLLDYGCSLTYNNCYFSNDCHVGQSCHQATI